MSESLPQYSQCTTPYVPTARHPKPLCLLPTSSALRAEHLVFLPPKLGPTSPQHCLQQGKLAADIPTGRETGEVQVAVQAWLPESRTSECLLLIAITPEPDNKGGSVSATTEAFSGKGQWQSSRRLASISLGYMGPWGWWKPVYFPQKT